MSGPRLIASLEEPECRVAYHFLPATMLLKRRDSISCRPPSLAWCARSLEVIVDDDQLTQQDRAAIQAGLASLDRDGGIPM